MPADQPQQPPPDRPELVLAGSWTPPRRLLRELVASRDLIAILGRKNFFVQYRRTAFGVLWAVGLPLVQALVIALVFSRVTSFTVANYALFVFSGMVAWTFFQGVLVPGATSIVDNSGLSSKVYFPRAVLPLAQCVTGLYMLGVSITVLLVFGAVSGADLGLRTLLLVPGAVLVAALATSFSLVLSVVNVYVRDVRYLVQAAALVWLWVTPVVYPLDAVPGQLRALLVANPMTGVVELFHAALIDQAGSLRPALVTVGWVVGLAALALVLNCRHDRVLADLL